MQEPLVRNEDNKDQKENMSINLKNGAFREDFNGLEYWNKRMHLIWTFSMKIARDKRQAFVEKDGRVCYNKIS